MPNDNFVAYMKTLEDLFLKKLEEYILEKHVIHRFIKLFKQIEFVHPCSKFPKNYLITLYA